MYGFTFVRVYVQRDVRVYICTGMCTAKGASLHVRVYVHTNWCSGIDTYRLMYSFVYIWIAELKTKESTTNSKKFAHY